MNGPRAQQRLVSKLQEAFGTTLWATLADPEVTEVMLNPDGQLFIERLGRGMERVEGFDGRQAEALIGMVAHALGQEVHAKKPIVSGEMPLLGHRFEGLLPPAVQAPTFSIRRHAIGQMTLCDYRTSGAMSAHQHDLIRAAIRNRCNILICGGTGSGKTTLANALMLEIHELFPRDRILLIEDTAEIRCAADNAVLLKSSEEVSIARLLKSALRLRPDRIMVGEVRDGAALTLLKAWNTGHPGGLTTLHANDAPAALTRLEQLVSEVSQTPMQTVIAAAVDLIIAVRRTDEGRRIESVLSVQGFHEGRYHLV
jgi:type IV secretion system protein VirB11